MKIFTIPFSILLLIVIKSASAQSSYQIKGIASDPKNEPLDAATVILQKAADSAVVKTTLTDADGRYEFTNVNEGTYSIKVSMLGYLAYRSKSFIVNAASPMVNLEKAVLRPEAEILKEVAVIGQKSMIEQKADRTVVNVDAMISGSGTNALELLEKIPGVTVDQNSSISMRGKSGVLVLIDDRPTYLSSADLAAYLRSLPSGTISQIELITNPPAKYDAAGNAGLINIKTKKTRINGIHGNFAASVSKGIYWRSNTSMNFNYRINKFNLFTNLAFNNYNSWRRLDLERKYYQPDGALNSVFSSTSVFYPKGRTPTLKLGMDYFLNKKTTLGFVINGSFNNNEESRPVNSWLYNENGNLDSLISASNGQENKFRNRSLNINFNHQYDSLGRSLSADFDFIKYNSNTNQSFLNNIFFADNTIKNSETISADLPSVINIYSAKTDYEHPLPGKAKIAAGLKTSYVSTDNAADYFIYENNIPSVDYDKTNRFKYDENINAAYLNFNKNFPRILIQTGLRLENTRSKGHQLGNAMKPDSSFTKNYTSLFPTAYVSYKLDTAGKQTLNFSYGRRIGRPYYQALNPFVFLLDKFSYFKGNPFLKPEYSSNFELSYNYNNRFIVNLLYHYSNDIQNEMIEKNGITLTSTTGNLGERIRKGISINTVMKRGSWWNCNVYTEIMNNRNKGHLASGILNTNSTYMSIRPSSQFSFKNGWSAELSGFYNTKITDGQFEVAASGAVDAGVQKKLLSNKASIKLAARDIFRTIASKGIIHNIPNTDASFHNFMDTRVVTASFSYSFSKGEVSTRKRNTGGAADEMRRVGN